MPSTKTKPKGKKQPGEAPDTPEPIKRAVPKPKEIPHVPTGTIEAANHADAEGVEKAVDVLHEALAKEEAALEHVSELAPARAMFQALRYSEPFRYLVALAVKAKA